MLNPVCTHIVLVGSSDWLLMWIWRITCIDSIRCHDVKCFQTLYSYKLLEALLLQIVHNYPGFFLHCIILLLINITEGALKETVFTPTRARNIPQWIYDKPCSAGGIEGPQLLN